jgi:hypothetical protein
MSVAFCVAKEVCYDLLEERFALNGCNRLNFKDLIKLLIVLF